MPAMADEEKTKKKKQGQDEETAGNDEDPQKEGLGPSDSLDEYY